MVDARTHQPADWPATGVTTAGALADLLVQALPPAHRPRAHALLTGGLVDQVVSRRPDEGFLGAYRTLVDTLTSVADGDRLEVLRSLPLAWEFEALSDAAISTAIARFFVEHPLRVEAPSAKAWLSPTVLRLRALSKPELEREAMTLERSFESWRTRALAESPLRWCMERSSFNDSLGYVLAAQSGNFRVAEMELCAFLKDIQEPVECVNLH